MTSSMDSLYDVKDETEMAPLFLFLASSFNVELVYVILKGITQFSYVVQENEEKGTDPRIQKKLQKINLTREYGNLNLKLTQIKIKDFDKWSQLKSDDDMMDSIKDITLDFKAE